MRLKQVQEQYTLSEMEHVRAKVWLEVKRAFLNGVCLVTVYGWIRPWRASVFVRYERTPLMRAELDKSTPKDEIRTCMESLLILTLQRLGTSEYHLRTKMRV